MKDAGVIGIPDEEAGELPLAFVVKQPGAKITEEELKKYVAGKEIICNFNFELERVKHVDFNGLQVKFRHKRGYMVELGL